MLMAVKETVISGNVVVKPMKRLPTKLSPNPVTTAISSPTMASQIPAPMIKADDIVK